MTTNRQCAEQRIQDDPTLEPRILDSLRHLPGTGPSQDEMYDLVARFMEETQPDVDAAWKHLLEAGWKYNVALHAFYNTDPAGSELTDIGDLESDLKAASPADDMSDLKSEDDLGEQGEPGTVTDTDTDSNTKTKRARQAAAVAENPGLDRNPAVLNGGPQPSKLTITLMKDGKSNTYTHRNEVYWHDPTSVHILNRWRAQVFLRNGNLPPVRDAIVPYLPAEADFITSFISDAKLAHDQSGTDTVFRPSWGDLHQRFNDRFEGKVLVGSNVKRPARSRESIRTHADRLQAVADIRGGRVRRDAEHRGRRRGKGKGKGKATEEDEEEDEGEDEDDDDDGDVEEEGME